MRLGTKIIIVGFILFTVGFIGIQITVSPLLAEGVDIPLLIILVNDVPPYLVFVGIITIIAGFIIRSKQYTGGMSDMRK